MKTIHFIALTLSGFAIGYGLISFLEKQEPAHATYPNSSVTLVKLLPSQTTTGTRIEVPVSPSTTTTQKETDKPSIVLVKGEAPPYFSLPHEKCYFHPGDGKKIEVPRSLCDRLFAKPLEAIGQLMKDNGWDNCTIFRGLLSWSTSSKAFVRKDELNCTKPDNRAARTSSIEL